MKAWLITVDDQFGATVVFAETRGKAKTIAMATDCCDDCRFCDIRVRRLPEADVLYEEGRVEIDWDNPKDRILLVKERGFHCEDIELETCERCPAKEYCDFYKDYVNENAVTN